MIISLVTAQPMRIVSTWCSRTLLSNLMSIISPSLFTYYISRRIISKTSVLESQRTSRVVSQENYSNTNTRIHSRIFTKSLTRASHSNTAEHSMQESSSGLIVARKRFIFTTTAWKRIRTWEITKQVTS